MVSMIFSSYNMVNILLFFAAGLLARTGIYFYTIILHGSSRVLCTGNALIIRYFFNSLISPPYKGIILYPLIILEVTRSV